MSDRPTQTQETGSPDRSDSAPDRTDGVVGKGMGDGLPTWAWALLLGSAAFLLGVRSLSFGFSYDDFWTILDNHYLHSTYGLRGLFDRTAASLAVPDAGRPVMVAIHWFEWRLFGARSSGYHLVDLLLHAGTVALVFLVFVELTGRKLLAGAAALLFAAHPLHAEVFAVTSFREDSLVTFFGLCWWWVSLATRRPKSGLASRLSAPLQVLSAFLFVLAVGSKESGAALLPAVWLVTAAARGHGPWEELKAGRWGYGAAALALAGLALFRFWSFGTLAPYFGPLYPHPGDLWHTGLLARMALATKAGLLGLGRFLWPFHLSPEYCLLGEPSGARALAWALLGLTLAGLPFWAWRRQMKRPDAGERPRPNQALVFSGLIFVLVAFAPTSNLFWMPNTEADRFWYLPSVGLVLVLAALAFSMAEGMAARLGPVVSRFKGRAQKASLFRALGGLLDSRVWAGLLLAPVVLASAAQLLHHLPVYRNDPTLWSVAWREAPCSPRAAVGQGFGLLRLGRVAQAEALGHKALALRPAFPPATFLLARIAEVRHQPDRAFRLYRRALRSGYWEPWRCHLGMARALLDAGKLGEAARQADMARLLAPHQVASNLLAFDLALIRGKSRLAGTFLARALGSSFH